MRLEHLAARTSTFPSLCAHWIGTQMVVLAGGGGADRSGRENRLELLRASTLEVLASEVLEGEPIFFLAPATHDERLFVAVKITSVAVYFAEQAESSDGEDPSFTLRNCTGWKTVECCSRVTSTYGCSDYLAFCTVNEETKQNTLHIWCYSCADSTDSDGAPANVAMSFVTLPSLAVNLQSVVVFIAPRIHEKYTELYMVSTQGKALRAVPEQIPHILGTETPYNGHPLSSVQASVQAQPGMHLCADGEPQLVNGASTLRALYPLHIEAGNQLAGHFLACFTGRKACYICLLDQYFAPVKICQVSSTLSCGISRFREDALVVFMVLSDGTVVTYDALSLRRLSSFKGREDSLLTALELSPGSSRCIIVSPAGVEVCSARPVNSDLQDANRRALMIAAVMLIVLLVGIYYRYLENSGRLETNPLHMAIQRLRYRHWGLKTHGSGHIKI